MKKLVYYTLVVLIIINIVNITNNNEIIPNESIRMRVIPNSNNTEDIYIKNKVKEYLEKDVLNMISKTNNIVRAIAAKFIILNLKTFLLNFLVATSK